MLFSGLARGARRQGLWEGGALAAMRAPGQRSSWRACSTSSAPASGAGVKTGGKKEKSKHELEHKFINGTKIALALRRQVAEDVAKLTAARWQPKLVSVIFVEREADGYTDTADSAIAWYVRNQRRVAEKCGIAFEEMSVPSDVGAKEFVQLLEETNMDPSVTGVVMQRPFPSHLNAEDIQMAIHPLKDVEGMHPASIGNVLYDEADLVACTAKAAVACLKSTVLAKGAQESLRGLSCVVVGHSEIVGKPISFLLMNEGAIVTTCHHMTKDLAMHTRKADAVFVAVGKAGLITGDMLKPGAALIDVGINPVLKKSSDGTEDYDIVGDADFESCVKSCGWITPVPGGVGPITTAVLMENTVRAARLQKAQYEAVFGHRSRSSNTYMFN